MTTAVLGTIELFRGPNPQAEGTPLEEWLQSNHLDDASWEWLRSNGIDDPDVWALYVPTGYGSHNRFFTCLPVRLIDGE
jgi:hypothetical protein